MAPPTLHSSTPALVANTSGNTFTTPAFSPPAGSMVIITGWGHQGSGNATTSIANNGAALTWTLIRQQNVEDGVTSAWYTVLSGARTNLTVSVTTSNAFQGGGVKGYVVQGFDPIQPLGDVKFGTSTALNFSATALVPQTAESLLFGTASNDNSANSTAPTSNNMTFVSSKTVGNQGVIAGYLVGPTPAGTPTTLHFATTVATTRHWNWVTFEVRNAIQIQTVDSGGIPSAEAFGSGTLTTGPVSVTGGSIPSDENFGSGRIAMTVRSDGIPTAEAFGTGGWVEVIGVVSGFGIPSAEAFGLGVVTHKNITPFGIPSAEAFGSGQVLAGPVAVTATGIVSGEAFGTHRLNLTIYTPGIVSGQAFGLGTLVAGPVDITSTGIPSAEAFGASRLTITVNTAVRRLIPRVSFTPVYEVLMMARLPQQGGVPTFILAEPIDWASLSWSTTLSAAQSISVDCQISSITEPIKQRLQQPLKLPTEIWLSRNGEIVAAGPLLGGTEKDNTLTIQAGGLMTYLDWMWITASKKFANTDQFTIVKTLVDDWQANQYGNFGIDTAQVGTSGVNRDLTYDRNEGHQVSRRIIELGASASGFDTEIDPASRDLKLWYPGKGVDRSSGEDAIVFDGRSIDGQGGMFSIGVGDIASVAFGSATPSGSETTFWSERVNNDLRAMFGYAGIAQSFSDVEKQNQLDDRVQAMIDARGEALRAPGKSVRVTADTDIGLYDVGDIVYYEISGVLGIGGAFRIRTRTVSVEASGQESVTLDFV